MTKDEKDQPSETELIAWAIPRIAQGHYYLLDEPEGRELVVEERAPSIEEMEGMLSAGRTEAEREVLRHLRENCRPQTIRDALVLLLGEKLGALCAQQFEGTPPDYEMVLAFAYEQQRRLLQSIQRIFIRGREGSVLNLSPV